jgi:hypothetical protein
VPRRCDVSRLRRRVVLQREYGRRGNLTVVPTCSVVLLWDDEKMISLSLSSAGVRPGVTVHLTMPLRACAVQCSSLFQRAPMPTCQRKANVPRCTSAEQPIQGTSCMHVHSTITELSFGWTVSWPFGSGQRCKYSRTFLSFSTVKKTHNEGRTR